MKKETKNETKKEIKLHASCCTHANLNALEFSPALHDIKYKGKKKESHKKKKRTKKILEKFLTF